MTITQDQLSNPSVFKSTTRAEWRILFNEFTFVDIARILSCHASSVQRKKAYLEVKGVL